MVRNTTAAGECLVLRAEATSKPLIPGIEMSSTMTSACRSSVAASAVAPSVNLPAISQRGERTAAARSRSAALSSTRTTRSGSDDVMFDGILDQLGGRLDVQ